MPRIKGIHTAKEFEGERTEPVKQALAELFDKGLFANYHKRGRASQGRDYPEGTRLSPSWALIVQNPELALHMARLSDYIVNDMPWTQRHDLRSLLIQTVNYHFLCEYSFDVWLKNSKGVGLDADMQAAIPYYKKSKLFTDEQKAVMEYAHAAIDGKVPDDLFAKVVGYFGEKQTLEFTVAVAYWSLWCIILNALEPPNRPKED